MRMPLPHKHVGWEILFGVSVEYSEVPGSGSGVWSEELVRTRLPVEELVPTSPRSRFVIRRNPYSRQVLPLPPPFLLLRKDAEQKETRVTRCNRLPGVRLLRAGDLVAPSQSFSLFSTIPYLLSRDSSHE